MIKKLEKKNNTEGIFYLTGTHKLLILFSTKVEIPTRIKNYKRYGIIIVPKESFIFGKDTNAKVLLDGKTKKISFYGVDNNLIYVPKDFIRKSDFATVILKPREWFKSWWQRQNSIQPPWITGLRDLKNGNFAIESSYSLNKIIEESVLQVKNMSGMTDVFWALSRIAELLTEKKTNRGVIRSNLRKNRKAIDISTFLMLSQLLNRKIDIKRIGSDNERGIKNPKLPFNLKNKEGIEILAMLSSDGYLGSNQFQVWNNSLWMLHKINENIQKIFGKTHYRFVERKGENRLSRGFVYNSKVIIQSLAKAGAVIGNKAKNNPHIPSWIMELPLTLQKHWMGIVFSAEGTINFYNNGRTISLGYSRAVEINLSKKAKEELKNNMNKFKDGKTPDGRPYKWIGVAKLKKLNLINTLSSIRKQRCNLIDDEIKMMNRWGIKIRAVPYKLHLYQNGRSTVIWKASTCKDALKLALIISPLIPEKQKDIDKFIGDSLEKYLRYSN